MLFAGVLGSSILVLAAAGALPLAMAYSERILQREIKLNGAFHCYGVDAPVSIETRIEGSHLYGRIINRHARGWLRLAIIRCTPVFANGTPSQRAREISVGTGGWLAPGEEIEGPLLSGDRIHWEPGMSMRLTSVVLAPLTSTRTLNSNPRSPTPKTVTTATCSRSSTRGAMPASNERAFPAGG